MAITKGSQTVFNQVCSQINYKSLYLDIKANKLNPSTNELQFAKNSLHV